MALEKFDAAAKPEPAIKPEPVALDATPAFSLQSSQAPSPPPPPAQKLTNRENHFPTISVTRAELVTLASHPRQPFRAFLESKGIVHKRGLMVESWVDGKDGGDGCGDFVERDGVTPKQHDVLYFRNFRPKTDAQIAKEDGGAGKVGLMR